jgi:hypothetical protein
MPRYWQVVYIPEHFQITRRRGFDVLGFKEEHRRTVELIAQGDRFLLYASKRLGFGAVCEARSRMFTDPTPIWTSTGKPTRPGEVWPLRVKTVPLVDLRGRWLDPLSDSVWGVGYYSGRRDPQTLGGKVVETLRKIDEPAGQRVEEAMRAMATAQTPVGGVAGAPTAPASAPEPRQVAEFPPGLPEAPSVAAPACDAPTELVPPPAALISAPRAKGRVFGPPLNFRELRHEPINEQGVVYLFGMVARELGFLVESIATGFPDCDAKRVTRGGFYEPVKIEFEYKASNFHLHGHDPSQCDLVVCWENDWPACPIDVLELRGEIRRLQG